MMRAMIENSDWHREEKECGRLMGEVLKEVGSVDHVLHLTTPT